MDKGFKTERMTDEVEIDLLEVFGVLLHWAWLIVLVGLAAGIVTFCVSKFALPEEFQSTTKVYVLNRSNGSHDTPTYQDLQMSTQLTKDYREMITSRYVLEKVITDLQLDWSYERLKKAVSVTTPTDSRIIQITVTDHDPADAQTICRAVRDEASKHIQSVMDIDAINLVDDANYPDKKSAPSNGKNALLGAVLAALVVSAFVVLRYLLDDTIKTSDDIENYLQMSCLAMIPLDEAVNTETPNKGKKAVKKK